MLKSFTVKNGRLVRTDANSKGKPQWIHLDNAKVSDYQNLAEFGISKNDFNLALNSNQRSRMPSSA